MPNPQKPLALPEFVLLLAMMVSIVALSIDAMLPALDVISTELGRQNPNDAQLIISSMFFGFAFGQILAGPLSDSFGRKPTIYAGYLIFITGCILSINAETFNVMLAGRAMQGFGAAFPRIISMALVRDGYEGRDMARINSVVMAIFILVPTIAPAIGQGILLFATWHAIFTMLLFNAAIAFAWFALRQPETLLSDKRRPFSLRSIFDGLVEISKMRNVVGYVATTGVVFGAFLGYLNSAQQIFQSAYDTGQWFAVYFGAAALAIGAASIVNSQIVVRFGMRFLTWRAMSFMTLLAIVFSGYAMYHEGLPPLPVFMVWLAVTFFCMGMLFGNLNALAMEPLGHMAGLGAAVIGSVSTFISLVLGWWIGGMFDETINPLVIGFAVLGCCSLGILWWTERE